MVTGNDRLDRIERNIDRLAEENLRRAEDERKRAEEERKRAEEERERAEERAKEDRKRAAEWRKEMADLDRRIGGVGNGLGRLSEGIIAPNIDRLLRAVNIKSSGISANPDRRRNGQTMEIDLLSVGHWRGGGPVVVAVEVSTHLTPAEVSEALAKFDRFFEFFAEYRAYDLVGAVAGMKVPEAAARKAEKAGLLVIAPSGETARLLNARPIRPKVWRANRRAR